MSRPPPESGTRKRCLIVYATPQRQYLWTVELPGAASIADALAAARAAAAQHGQDAGIPWDTAAVGIFGEARARSAACADGDRIEIYRPLRQDPRSARRERVQRARRRQQRRGD